MNFINKNAIYIILGLLSLITIFHLSILFKITPYTITWGGRLENDSEMYVFETISILTVGFLILNLLMKRGLIRFRFSKKVVSVVLWFYFVVFTLNTIANIFAVTFLEKSFALLTGLLAMLLLIIIQEKPKEQA
jgi:hypothetical protein